MSPGRIRPLLRLAPAMVVAALVIASTGVGQRPPAAGSVAKGVATTRIGDANLAATAANSSRLYAGFLKYSSRTNFITVRANFTVPTVTCGGGGSGDAAEWTGIGSNGYLAQTGVDATCSGGTPFYYGFAQFWMVVNGAQRCVHACAGFTNTVNAGDSMTSITHNSGGGCYTTTLTDHTRGWSAPSSYCIGKGHAHAAEVFVEKPPTTRTLAKFGSVAFTNVVLDGKPMGTKTPTKYIMEKNGNTMASTGGWANSGSDFTVTWRAYS